MHVLIFCGDGLLGLRDKIHFPQADLQLCVVHHIRNVTKFVCWKDRKVLCADMRPIYTAPTIEAVTWHANARGRQSGSDCAGVHSSLGVAIGTMFVVILNGQHRTVGVRDGVAPGSARKG